MFQSKTPLPFGNNFGCFTNTEEDHEEFAERLRKSLYYGKLPGTERPSMPLTDMAVEFFQEAAPRKLGRLDTYFAASSARSACMTPTSVIVGMMYVKRLQKRKPEYLAQISSSELFLISMMMASKFLYDEGVDEEVFNDEWATSGDLDTEDVNELEREFLTAIEWDLFVRPDDFSDMLNTVEKRTALTQGLKRGWFSYTDLFILSMDLTFMNWHDLAAELSKVISVSTLAYLASIMTMIGSTVLGTTTSTALMSAGAAISHDASLFLPSMLGGNLGAIFTPSMLEGNIGSILTEELTRLDAANSSEVEFAFSKDLSALVPQSSIENTLNGKDEDNHKHDQSHSVEKKGAVGSNTDALSREQGTFFNGFLPPFLALVALKDTLVKFAYAVADKPETASDGNLGDVDSITETCSDGPCLMDSWPHCWNVSSDFDWTEFKTFHAKSASRLDLQCMLASRFSSQNRAGFGRQDQCRLGNSGGTNRPWTGSSNNVHCCCSWSGHPDHDFDCSSLDLKLPDLTFGFMTSNILVTA